MKSIMLTCLMMFIGHNIFADSTMVITLVNNSNKTLTVSGLETQKGTKLAVSAGEIAPGAQTKIEGTIMADIDLQGSVLFNNSAYRFNFTVPRLKHFGQPTFTMHGEKITSTVDRDSLRFNPGGNGTDLAYTAVTVFIEDSL